MKITNVSPPVPGRASILARIDRLPPSRHLLGLVARIAAGGWFEFFELFMPGFISLGMVREGIFTLTNKGLLDTHSFCEFPRLVLPGHVPEHVRLRFRLGQIRPSRHLHLRDARLFASRNLLSPFSAPPRSIDIARFVAGCAVGMQLINNDSYIAELTPRVGARPLHDRVFHLRPVGDPGRGPAC